MCFNFKCKMNDFVLGTHTRTPIKLTELPKWRLERILRIANVKGRSHFKKRKHLIYQCKRVLGDLNPKKRRIQNTSEEQNLDWWSMSMLPLEIVHKILMDVSFESLIQFGQTGKREVELVKSIFAHFHVTIDMLLAKPVLLQITIMLPVWGPAIYPLDEQRVKRLIRDIFQLDLKISVFKDLNRLQQYVLNVWTERRYILMCSIKTVGRVKHFILVYDNLTALLRIKAHLFNKYGLVTNIRNLNKYWCPKDCLTL